MRDDLLTVVVKKSELQGHNVLVLELADVAGAPLPLAEAGAHIDVHLAHNLVRQYSLCHDPLDQQTYRLGVLKDPQSRGGSVAAHAALRVGHQIQISPPRNLFALHAEAQHTVLIGGGIGVTPMIAMAYSLWHQGKSFELHYCGKDQTQCAFIDELAQAPFKNHVQGHFKAQGGDHRQALRQMFLTPQKEAHVYVCGPVGLMQWVEAEALAAGYEPERIHQEYFQVDADLSGSAFEIEAKRSGLIIQVGADETIVAALAKHHIEVEVSCEQGICGTCLCDVLEGEPEHRDVYLTDEEKQDNDQIMLCCSRAKSARLVLDI
ncbi:2Fe-2S iron-sulfur cluster-binding protein [Neisseriaceae bacterium CLB008]